MRTEGRRAEDALRRDDDEVVELETFHPARVEHPDVARRALLLRETCCHLGEHVGRDHDTHRSGGVLLTEDADERTVEP